MIRPFVWAEVGVPVTLSALFVLGAIGLGSCATDSDRINAALAVERSCSAYTTVLGALTRHKSELSGDTIATVDGFNAEADLWCLPDAPVPTSSYEAIARLAEMTSKLGAILAASDA